MLVGEKASKGVPLPHPSSQDEGGRAVPLSIWTRKAAKLTPVIPALWDTEVGGSQCQEIETILAYMVKSYLH